MEYPEKYWHCMIQRDNQTKGYSVANDMTFTELNEKVITPWNSNKPFTINGEIVRNQSQIKSIKIVHTEREKAFYAAMHNQRMRNSGIADMATDRSLLPFTNGKDYTFEFLFKDN